MEVDIQTLKKISDDRGFLIEFLRWTELVNGQSDGQIYCVTIQPGCQRGNHFHHRTYEWLGVLSGKLRVILEDVETKERIVIDVDAASNEGIKRIKYGPKVAHQLKNISDIPAVVVVYMTEEYETENSDHVSYKLD